MKRVKGLITPLTISSFFLMAFTGILMFFHLDIGLNKFAHEWLSWLFLAAVILHTALVHKKSFLSYFKRTTPMIIIGAGILLTAFSFANVGGKGEHPFQQAARALYKAELSVAGKVLGMTSREIRSRLEQQGLEVENSDNSLKLIAKRNGVSNKEILEKVFDH